MLNEVMCTDEYEEPPLTSMQVKNPVKTLKSVAPAGLVSACVLYVLVNIAYFLVVPLDEIKKSGEMIAALFFERVFGQSIGRTILPMAVAVSAAGVRKVSRWTGSELKRYAERDGGHIRAGERFAAN